ncbi:chromosomal replication initiator DnaA [Sphingoaurantiacus capsulatus]|uniref:Chromosomal replication initiator DnaA n=1 Tax=Sphingoaurantiacus capsulatus TaxID=1771310 RepID=A0ABV7XG59_9SPHN
MSQIALPLAYKAADGERDFFVSDANSHAVIHLDRWPDWPQPVALLTGPEGSGKSHLGRIFARQTGAEVIDDLGETQDDEAVFHAWNRAGERPLLLISRLPPPQWQVALPDLRSRLAATPQVAIAAPDDALLTAVMAKQFRDRGLTVGPDVIAYVLARIERSFAKAADVVDRLDTAALAAGRAVTVPLARAVLPEQLDLLE